MKRPEISLAIQWAVCAGWNPGLNDAECFYRADSQGFFAGKLNKKMIAMGSAVIYDHSFAFCGFYMVAPHYQHHGYGISLTKSRLAYVGKRNVGIDGVLEMVNKYQHLGYQVAHQNTRFCGKHLTGVSVNVSHPNIVPLKSIPFHELLAYDRLHFPAQRKRFLTCWIKQPQSQSIGFIHQHKLAGYGVIRRCHEGYKIGPLFADNEEIAHIMFTHLIRYAQGEAVYLDIPEHNTHFALTYGMHKVFATARMYLRGEPKLAMHHVYGITSFELG